MWVPTPVATKASTRFPGRQGAQSDGSAILSESFWNYGYVFARALSLWERVAEGQVRACEHNPRPALRATFSQREKNRANT
jgi:hypothetical protein